MKINIYTKIAIGLCLFVLAFYTIPSVASAQPTGGVVINCSLTNLSSLVTCAASVMNVAVWFLMSASFIYTVYGAFRFIGAEGNDREKWRSVIIYGIVGLFVIVSIWGLVSILESTFNLDNDQITPPAFTV